MASRGSHPLQPRPAVAATRRRAVAGRTAKTLECPGTRPGISHSHAGHPAAAGHCARSPGRRDHGGRGDQRAGRLAAYLHRGRDRRHPDGAKPMPDDGGGVPGHRLARDFSDRGNAPPGNRHAGKRCGPVPCPTDHAVFGAARPLVGHRGPIRRHRRRHHDHPHRRARGADVSGRAVGVCRPGHRSPIPR